MGGMEVTRVMVEVEVLAGGNRTTDDNTLIIYFTAEHSIIKAKY